MPSKRPPAASVRSCGSSSVIAVLRRSSAGRLANSWITLPSAAVIAISGPIGSAPWDTHGCTSTPASATPHERPRQKAVLDDRQSFLGVLEIAGAGEHEDEVRDGAAERECRPAGRLRERIYAGVRGGKPCRDLRGHSHYIPDL